MECVAIVETVAGMSSNVVLRLAERLRAVRAAQSSPTAQKGLSSKEKPIGGQSGRRR